MLREYIDKVADEIFFLYMTEGEDAARRALQIHIHQLAADLTPDDA